MLDIKKIAAAAMVCVMSFSAGALADNVSAYDLRDTGLYETSGASKSSAKNTIPVIKSYKADQTSITLTWKKVSGADGYTVYMIKNNKASIVSGTSGGTSAVITGLDTAKEYIFTVKAYTLSGSKKKYGKASEKYTAVTAPAKSGTVITTLSYNHKKDKMTVKWNKAKCSGYMIYAYTPYDGGRWIKVKTVDDPDKLSAVFDYEKIYSEYMNALYASHFSEVKGADRYYALLDQGGTMGYRFAIKTFTRDSGKHGTFTSKINSMQDIYYDIDDLKDSMGSKNYKLLNKVLKKNYTGVSARKYNFYVTSADDSGKITSTVQELRVSDASVNAIKKFASEHFKSGWTDAEKLIYTINWINKNVDYDYEYSAPGRGYADNVFTYRKGQCDSYNGAIAEMLTYLGYKDVVFQCMTPSVRGSQHLRTAIYSGGKYYTFECGNFGKNGSWMWFISKGLEVPLKS